MDVLNEIYNIYQYEIILEYYASNVELATSLTDSKRIKALENISKKLKQELSSDNNMSGASLWMIDKLRNFKGCRNENELLPFIKVESVKMLIDEVGKEEELFSSISKILAKMKIDNEIELLESKPIIKKEKLKPIPAKFYVLAYVIEKTATKSPIPMGDKTKIEEIGNEILGEGRGNTFYRNFNNLFKENILDKNKLELLFGTNWLENVLKICANKTQFKTYIKSLNLK